MLKDKQLLLEHEFTRTCDQAAKLYLKIVTTDGDVADPEYRALQDKIASLRFDLDMINRVIYKNEN
jgi:formate dehydrogenase maturation protein FdhE